MALHCIQELDTSGARAAETWVHEGTRYLAVPQLAQDFAGQPAQMTLGNSDVDALIFRWEQGRFVPHDRLPVPGGEDAEFFRIGKRAFLATASLRSGSGPYELNVESVIYEQVDGKFIAFQRVPTFAAKQWKHFSIGARQFLALAQGVSMPGAVATHSSKSCIYEWNGERFVHFQDVPSTWGYNWAFFEVGGQRLLAHADHAEPSQILRWDGERFQPFQTLEGKSGRAFCFFEAGDAAWLAFANLHEDSLLYRWDGERFAPHQVFAGAGGREFCWIPDAQGGLLVQVNFLHGTREAPITQLASFIYRFDRGRCVVAEEFQTLGGTDAAWFEEAGRRYLVVANSLSAGVRFRTPSKLYELP